MQVQAKVKMKPQSVKIDPALLSRGRAYTATRIGMTFSDLLRFAIQEYLNGGDFEGVDKTRKYKSIKRVATTARMPLGMLVELNEVARELAVDNCQVYEAAIRQYLNLRS